MLDHAGLEAGSLDAARLALFVLGTHTDVDEALDVDHYARDRQAALVAALAVLARPLDLRVRKRDQRRVGADAVDQERPNCEMPSCGAASPTPSASFMIPRHPAHLPAQGVVEAIDGRGAGLQDGVAETVDEGHGGDPPGLELGVELGGLLLVALYLHLEVVIPVL